jgi:putative membrane protein
MKKHILLAAAASLALAPAAFAQSNMSPGAGGERSGSAGQSQLQSADQDFVKKAAIGGMFEVQSSEIAQDKAQSAEVKEFAEQMITDHGKANKELESAAQDLGATVPEELDAKHQQALQKLESASEGAEFDRAYIQAQRNAHKEAVNLFSSYSKSGGDAQLTSWAQKTLPTLQEHARHIQGLNVASRDEGSSSSGRSAAEPRNSGSESQGGGSR